MAQRFIGVATVVALLCVVASQRVVIQRLREQIRVIPASVSALHPSPAERTNETSVFADGTGVAPPVASTHDASDQHGLGPETPRETKVPPPVTSEKLPPPPPSPNTDEKIVEKGASSDRTSASRPTIDDRLSAYVGDGIWMNTNPLSLGVRRLVLSNRNGDQFATAWGAC